MWPLPYGLRFLFAYIPLLRPSLTDSPLGQTVPGTCAWFTPHTWPQHTHTLIISKLPSGQFSSVAHVWLFATQWTAARQAFLSITYSQSLLTDAHWVGDAMQLSHPLLSPFLLPSIFPGIRVFYNESVLHIRWPKYWSVSFSISPSNEYFRKCSLGISNLLEEISSLSHSIVFLYLHWSLRKAFLSPCYSLEFCIQMVYLSFSPLPLASLLFSAVWKASSENHFPFLLFFFSGMVLITASRTMSQTSVHSSSGTLSIKSNLLNHLSLLLYNHKGFHLDHTCTVWWFPLLSSI